MSVLKFWHVSYLFSNQKELLDEMLNKTHNVTVLEYLLYGTSCVALGCKA